LIAVKLYGTSEGRPSERNSGIGYKRYKNAQFQSKEILDYGEEAQLETIVY
jgi:hypothetical protein